MFKNIMFIFLIALCLLAPFFGIMAIVFVVIVNRIIARSSKGISQTRKELSR